MEAAIFDMDGLLIDSEPLWRRAEQSAFHSIGIDLDDDQCAQTTGMRIDEVVEYWFQQEPRLESVEQLDRESLTRSILEGVTTLIQTEGEELPGVRGLLDSLLAQGMRLAVASSSPRPLIDAVLEKLEIATHFEVIRSAVDEPFGKPHPAVYLRTASDLGVDPSQCLALEDSVAGVRSAKAAGMTVIAVPARKDFDNPAFELADLKIASLVDFELNLRWDLDP